jgi:hypothetical protein
VAPIRPALLFQWDGVGAGEGELTIHPRSSRHLVELIRETGAQVGVPIELLESGAGDASNSWPQELRVVISQTPTIHITQTNTGIPTDQDGLEQILADRLKGVGQVLALALTRTVRQVSY